MGLIPNSVSRAVGQGILKTKKNSPHILFVGGVLGVIGSTALACRATLKVEEVVDEAKHDIDSVKELRNSKAEQEDHEYTEKEYYRDLGYVYGKSAARLGKLYGPAIIGMGASITALTTSHIQMKHRNDMLAAAFGAVSVAFEEYRGRVRDAIGEERERDIYVNAKMELVEDEDGNKKPTKVVYEFGKSPYARFFDEYSTQWQKSAELNRMFVMHQQNYANQRLQTKGHVLLNEVYDWLGLERSPEGCVMGWLRDGDGEGYVDFGLNEEYSKPFLGGYERSVLLDFNVDPGYIYDKI